MATAKVLGNHISSGKGKTEHQVRHQTSRTSSGIDHKTLGRPETLRPVRTHPAQPVGTTDTNIPMPGLIPVIKQALLKSHGKGNTIRAALCYEGMVHVGTEPWDAGWGCG